MVPGGDGDRWRALVRVMVVMEWMKMVRFVLRRKGIKGERWRKREE